MKNIHLHYNPLTNSYIFVVGQTFNSGERQEWRDNNKGLVKRLEISVDRSRKSSLYLKDIPEELREPIKKIFKNTRVKVRFESN